jgi:radical SAM protein with 4Fe4S-binding SPASM domain
MDLIIKPTELCNFKCSFCSSTKISEERSSILDSNKIFKFLKRFPDTRTIIVNGGDPLMVDPSYYWKIIEFLDDNDLNTTLSLTTNLWPFYKKPEKWTELFRHHRVGISTSFQYGNGRLKGDYSVFTEKDFWNVSDSFLEKIGYRHQFIAVITEENQSTVIKTVELAKKMNVICKINHAMSSGDQSHPYRLSKIYEKYVEIWKLGLHPWEYNTQQMMKRLVGGTTTCPQTRTCDSNSRALNPEGDYSSCGSFADDKEKSIDFNQEMMGSFFTPLQESLELLSLKQSCFSCPMFQICNGCKKTVKDMKRSGIVEDHCKHMKKIAPDILKSNNLNIPVTPYEDESKVYVKQKFIPIFAS